MFGYNSRYTAPAAIMFNIGHDGENKFDDDELIVPVFRVFKVAKGKGIRKLKKVAPQVAKRMGYKKGMRVCR